MFFDLLSCSPVTFYFISRESLRDPSQLVELYVVASRPRILRSTSVFGIDFNRRNDTASERNARTVNIYLYALIVPLGGSTCRARCAALHIVLHDEDDDDDNGSGGGEW